MEPRPPAIPSGLGAYLSPGLPSFTDFVTTHAPHLMPAALRGDLDGLPARQAAGLPFEHTHGTTIVALTFADGVIIAGDRRATAGNTIAVRDMDKVFVTDSHSAVGISGSAGVAQQMVRLYSADLEHYEKIQGVPLSLDGKANKLAGMVAGNLAVAMQGFVVVPLFVGYDPEAEPGRAARIISYDPTGSRHDEASGYHAVGSGSVYAKSALKKRHDPTADRATAVRAAVEALYDAADDDTATGGPDIARRIYPVVITITGPDGAVRRPEEEIAEIAAAVVAARNENIGG